MKTRKFLTNLASLVVAIVMIMMGMPMQTVTATVNATETISTTYTLGDANATETISTTYTLGDANYSGTVDAEDAAATLEYAAATGTGTLGVEIPVINVDAADIDKDGDADAEDAAAILVYSAQQGVANPDEAYIEGDFRYRLQPGGAVITGYCTLQDPLVIIPDHLGGHAVIGIDSYTFADHTEIVYLQLPNTLEWIGDHAFENCSNIKELILPESVTYIGKYAFAGACYRGEVSWPNGSKMENIGEYAFYGCKMEKVYLPSGIRVIGEYSFAECSWLIWVKIPKGLEEIREGAFYSFELFSRELAYESSDYWWNLIKKGDYWCNESCTIVTWWCDLEW